MNLTDYLKTVPLAQRADFAKRCGTTFDYLRQIAYGKRLCRESIAINIDRETQGLISHQALRPDVDWAYLQQKYQHSQCSHQPG